jgi:hypothetical protein
LVKKKANLRKRHVQNEMLKVREQYEAIFDEIEGNVDLDVRILWPSSDHPLGPPVFVSKRAAATIEQQRRLRQAERDTNNTNTLKGNNQLITKGSIMKFVPTEPVKDKKEAVKDEKNLSAATDNISSEVFASVLTTSEKDVLEKVDFGSMSKSELIGVRENLSLEVLWIQQAIQSRIQVF